MYLSINDGLRRTGTLKLLRFDTWRVRETLPVLRIAGRLQWFRKAGGPWYLLVIYCRHVLKLLRAGSTRFYCSRHYTMSVLKAQLISRIRDVVRLTLTGTLKFLFVRQVILLISLKVDTFAYSSFDVLRPQTFVMLSGIRSSTFSLHDGVCSSSVLPGVIDSLHCYSETEFDRRLFAQVVFLLYLYCTVSKFSLQ